MAQLEPPVLSDGSPAFWPDDPGGGTEPATGVDGLFSSWSETLGSWWLALFEVAREKRWLTAETAIAISLDTKKLLDLARVDELERWTADIGASDPDGEASLSGLPFGYRLIPDDKNSTLKSTSSQRGNWGLLVGHPSGNPFASPTEFWPHLVWLFSGCRTPCACDLCRKWKLEPTMESLKGQGDLFSAKLGPVASGAAGPPRFRLGDVVVIHLELSGSSGNGHSKIASDNLVSSVCHLKHLPRGIKRAPVVVAGRAYDQDNGRFLYHLRNASDDFPETPEDIILPYHHYSSPFLAGDSVVDPLLNRRGWFSWTDSSVPSDADRWVLFLHFLRNGSYFFMSHF